MIPDAAVEAAMIAWLDRSKAPGSWSLEEEVRAALEAAAPHLLAVDLPAPDDKLLESALADPRYRALLAQAWEDGFTTLDEDNTVNPYGKLR